MCLVLQLRVYNIECVSQASWMISFSPQPHARGSVEIWRCSPARNRPTPGRNMLTYLYKLLLNTNCIAFHNCGRLERVSCFYTWFHVPYSHSYALCRYLNILKVNKTLPRFMITYLFSEKVSFP